jgi:hypothetical protein
MAPALSAATTMPSLIFTETMMATARLPGVIAFGMARSGRAEHRRWWPWRALVDLGDVLGPMAARDESEHKADR